jgi:hypothetical protein
MMTKRRVIGFLMVFAPIVWASSCTLRDRARERDFDAVLDSMTPEQVVRLMGQPWRKGNCKTLVDHYWGPVFAPNPISTPQPGHRSGQITGRSGSIMTEKSSVRV